MCSVIVAAHNYGEALRNSETTSPRKWWPTSQAFRPTLDHHNYNHVVSDLGGEAEAPSSQPWVTKTATFLILIWAAK